MDPKATSPETGTAEGDALSFEDGVDAIGNLLDDSDDAPNPDDKVEAQADDDTPDEDVEDDATAEEEQDDDAEDPDGSGDVKGGRFAPDTAKVTLSDGTVITVAELKRNNLFQADYTRKTTEIAEERKSLDGAKSQIGQIATALSQQRDFLLQAAQQFLPKAPSRSMLDSKSQDYDPIGYASEKAEFDDRTALLNQLRYQMQAEQGRQSQETEAQQRQRREDEGRKLVASIPELGTRKNWDQFWGEAVETAQSFGYAPEEFAEIADDHRVYRVLHELIRLRKAVKRAPQVKQELQAKPKLMTGGKRMDPKAKTSREAEGRREALRKTGDFDAGVAALMDLNL